MSAVTSVCRRGSSVRNLNTPCFHFVVFINMNLCTIFFNEQTIYLFNKLNGSIPPTSKTATALLQRQLPVDGAIL